MKLSYIFFAVAFGSTIIGCHSKDQTALSPLFSPDTDKAQVDAFANAQAAAATRAESTLYEDHFAGDGLNSLGKAKLDSLIAGSDKGCTTKIYLSAACDTPEHRAATSKYLTCHGLKVDRFTFVAGTNPDSYTMTAQSIKDLDAMAGASSAAPDNSSSSLGGASLPGEK